MASGCGVAVYILIQINNKLICFADVVRCMQKATLAHVVHCMQKATFDAKF
jgi:hypothetical protein